MEFLEFLERESERVGIPYVPKEDGLIIFSLFSYIKMKRGRIKAVDLGAGIGVSTAWIAMALDEKDELYAVERDPLLYKRALSIWSKSPFKVRVKFVNKDALNFLDESSFHAAFIDIEKDLYEEVLKRAKYEDFLLFHNAIFPKPPRGFFEAVRKRKHVLIPTTLGLMLVT